MENVSLLDLVSIALIAFLGIKGILRGFVKEVFGLIGIIGGIYIASKFAQGAGKYISENFFHFQNEKSISIVGFVTVLIIFWLIATVVGNMLGKLVNSSGLGIVDKILGFFVGAAKIFLIFSIIIYVLSSIGPLRGYINDLFSDSFMYPHFKNIGSKIVQLDPATLKKQAEEETKE